MAWDSSLPGLRPGCKRYATYVYCYTCHHRPCKFCLCSCFCHYILHSFRAQTTAHLFLFIRTRLSRVPSACSVVNNSAVQKVISAYARKYRYPLSACCITQPQHSHGLVTEQVLFCSKDPSSSQWEILCISPEKCVLLTITLTLWGLRSSMYTDGSPLAWSTFIYLFICLQQTGPTVGGSYWFLPGWSFAANMNVFIRPLLKVGFERKGREGQRMSP